MNGLYATLGSLALLAGAGEVVRRRPGLLASGSLNDVSADRFWSLVDEIGWGTKTTDYEAIRSDLSRRFSSDEIEQYKDVLRELQYELMDVISAYEERTGKSTGTGDDGFSDLTAHIVGLGRTEYEATLRDPGRAVRRAKKRDYKESFSYAFPLLEE